MIPDGALIHKHLPRQADIDRIMIQINRKYLRKMHLPCSLKDMQAAYMQSPHFCDIYNVLMFNKYPKSRKTVEKLQQAMMGQYMVQGGLLYIYVVRRRGRLAPRQPLSVCALLPAYEENRHLRPLGNLGHRLRRPRWID